MIEEPTHLDAVEEEDARLSSSFNDEDEDDDDDDDDDDDAAAAARGEGRSIACSIFRILVRM